MNNRISRILKSVTPGIVKNKYLLIAVLIGALLLVIPTARHTEESGTAQTEESVFSVAAEEKRLESILAKIEGAGSVRVMLSVKSGTERILAVDESTTESEDKTETSRETVIVSKGSSVQDVVVLSHVYPEYSGAVIVAEGAGSSAVKLRITEAVAAVTGLRSDRITVVKMKK